MDSLEKKVVETVESLFPELVRISRTIHDRPELGYEEWEAAALLTDFLQQQGFEVEPGIGGVSTAFRASRSSDPGPTIAFLAEYDALPNLGHACGHNLIAAAGVGAGAALVSVFPACAGAVQVVGTPAEEMHGGKIRLIEKGCFDGIDAALMFHPSVRNAVVKRTLAMTELRIAFYGKSSHAAAAPELGINALDAMILAFSGINALRQQVPDDGRIHGIITRGGDAPNIIPAFTEARIAVRALERPVMEKLVECVKGCIEGAARATGCTFEIENTGPVYEGMMPNRTMAAVFQEKIEAFGIPIDDQDELRYIGSSDIGNLSRRVPAIHPELLICDFESMPHTAGFAEAARSEAAETVMKKAACALALTGLMILRDPEVREKMVREFRHVREGTTLS
ncbi:MAG: M20 family metallopeptidase [Deltaproteobacteria bacterium]|nr:M20 family metallopeptidase [Deltaproteobacteria bacterium]